MDDRTLEEKVDHIVKAEGWAQKYVLQAIIIVFLAGGGWMTLKSVEALADENKDKIEEQAESDAETQQKLTRIETTQGFILKKQNEQDKKLDMILEKLDND